MQSTHGRRKWRDALIPFTLFSLFALLISLALSAPALADPPGRIGRVAWLSETGGLRLDNRSSGESFRPLVNQPLTSGDQLSTDGDTRAEIQIGSMTLHLDTGTSLELMRVDDEQVSAFLRNGGAIVKLASPETAREFELNTANGRFTANVVRHDGGIFRVDANDNGSSATAYSGSLHFSANDADFDIQTGERADVWYAGQTRYRVATPASDDFMRWSAARDQQPAGGVSSRYVSPEMTGADDLDAWGDWSETPEYGALWTPRSVAIDWAPYRSGHWVWVAPWGWSWVGHEPWGFAPFHYGRWVHHRGRWAWVPGAHITRPVYAPALVAWRSPSELSVAMSFGRAPTSGWLPLAPRDVYVPVYRSSPDYVRRINRTHVAHVSNVNVMVDNPGESVRQQHYIHREPLRPEPPAHLVHHSYEKRDWGSTANPRESHRDKDERKWNDKRHEEREDRREQPHGRQPLTETLPAAKRQHPDMAFLQMSQQPRPPAKVVQPETHLAKQRTPDKAERSPDTARRASPEDDRRKRHQRRDDEGRL